jgi:hypothetical protein
LYLLLIILGTSHAASKRMFFSHRTEDRQTGAMPIKRHNHSDDRPSCYHTTLTTESSSTNNVKALESSSRSTQTHQFQRRAHVVCMYVWASSKLRGAQAGLKSELPSRGDGSATQAVLINGGNGSKLQTTRDQTRLYGVEQPARCAAEPMETNERRRGVGQAATELQQLQTMPLLSC